MLQTDQRRRWRVYGLQRKHEDTWTKIKDFLSNNIATPSKVLSNLTLEFVIQLPIYMNSFVNKPSWDFVILVTIS